MEISRTDFKKIWFYYFIAHKKNWGYGLNYAKLKKMKTGILDDEMIWNDVMDRHNFASDLPWKAEIENKAMFDHALGNLAGMIYRWAIIRGYINV